MKILKWLWLVGCLFFITSIFAEPNRVQNDSLICHLQLNQLSASQIMQKFSQQAHKNRVFKILYGDGEWTIKTIGRKNFIKYYVSRKTGRITGRKIYYLQDAFDYPHDVLWSNKMLSLSKVVSLLENAGYSNIEFAQWTGATYVAHVCYEHKWNNIQIDALSGSLVRRNAPRSLEVQ